MLFLFADFFSPRFLPTPPKSRHGSNFSPPPFQVGYESLCPAVAKTRHPLPFLKVHVRNPCHDVCPTPISPLFFELSFPTRVFSSSAVKVAEKASVFTFPQARCFTFFNIFCAPGSRIELPKSATRPSTLFLFSLSSSTRLTGAQLDPPYLTLLPPVFDLLRIFDGPRSRQGLVIDATTVILPVGSLIRVAPFTFVSSIRCERPSTSFLFVRPF